MEQMKLYEIDERIAKCFDEETGEIIDAEELDAMNVARQDKLEAIALIVKNREAFIDDLMQEKKLIFERIDRLKNRNENTLKFLSDVLDGKKFETTKVECKFRKSTSVDILNEAAVPKEYKEEERVIKIKKADILKALRSGEKVDGCSLIEKNNLSVK